MEWQNGIDTTAHTTTLEEHGKTIAVLGGGFYNIFPAENEELYKQIIRNYGLIVSEYAPEEKATSKKFLERNRIVSGISLGVLIIESAYRSGTSVTAKLAKQQERKIFVLPHEIHDKHGVGNNKLIKDKIATIVCTTKDIIEEIPNLKYKEIIEYKTNDSKIDKAVFKNLSEENNNRKRQVIKKRKCENENYNEVYKFITEETCSLDEIYKKCNKNISEINNILLMLEIEGYIEKVPGGYKCITSNY